MQEQVWTVKDISLWCRKFLENKSPSHRLDSDLLLAKALGCKRIDLYCSYEKPVTAEERQLLKALLARRAEGEPIAYILGTKEFYGREFIVDSRALIPRSETEHLVEEAVRRVADIETPKILDIGTGSGCIALTLKAEISKSLVEAWDKSAEAIELAELNRSNLGIDLVLKEIDAFNPPEDVGKFDLIVSNPPYIPSSHVDSGLVESSVYSFEPHVALFSEGRGFAFYELYASGYHKFLEDDGTIMTEIGFDQGAIVAEIFRSHGWRNIELKKDLSGHDRIVIANKP